MPYLQSSGTYNDYSLRETLYAELGYYKAWALMPAVAASIVGANTIDVTTTLLSAGLSEYAYNMSKIQTKLNTLNNPS
jgi:hypothetical protein